MTRIHGWGSGAHSSRFSVGLPYRKYQMVERRRIRVASLATPVIRLSSSSDEEPGGVTNVVV